MDKLPLISQLIGPLTDLLKLLTGVLHSYGLAIIVFTILVRAVLAPLNLRQLHSARKMAALAPRIKELQQKYKGNRDELTKATMALYKEEGANPAAGCLPLLVQMPVLYALFFVFNNLARTSIHGATAIYHLKFLWFVLDKPDHLFGQFLFGPHSGWGPLPILAAVTQWIQQRMMMQPTSDPQQRSTQQIMQFMPLMIFFFATNYAAGLALYWVTSTIFAIAMQYFVTGWGQLFTSPFRIPDAPAASQRRTPPTALRENGKGSRLGLVRDDKESVARVTPSAPSTSSPRVTDDGPDGSVVGDDVRLGKMQRAAMRPRARPRSSKGAKR